MRTICIVDWLSLPVNLLRAKSGYDSCPDYSKHSKLEILYVVYILHPHHYNCSKFLRLNHEHLVVIDLREAKLFLKQGLVKNAIYGNPVVIG